jgi:beta-lactamase class A
MAVLHASENNPSLLDAKINVPATVALPVSEQDFFPPMNPVQSGSAYGIPALLNQLITQSDNGANAILIQYIGDNAMSTIFDTLNVPVPGDKGGVTVQQYSHLFRVLYNGSYLSPANSERALDLLTKTAFTQGLVSGVPAGTVVAHKFGESTTGGSASDPNAVHELHDCGIVYYPNHPYFLCVMTRGSDFTTLASVIKDVSQTTWNQVTLLK